jgi:hypothetical protein
VSDHFLCEQEKNLPATKPVVAHLPKRDEILLIGRGTPMLLDHSSDSKGEDPSNERIQTHCKMQ